MKIVLGRVNNNRRGFEWCVNLVYLRNRKKVSEVGYKYVKNVRKMIGDGVWVGW